MIKIQQTNSFKKAYKKCHSNQLKEINKVIQKIIDNPAIGDKKIGDLADVFVYKTRILAQLILIAYSYKDRELVLTFIAIGSHENFYKNLKI